MSGYDPSIPPDLSPPADPGWSPEPDYGPPPAPDPLDEDWAEGLEQYVERAIDAREAQADVADARQWVEQRGTERRDEIIRTFAAGLGRQVDPVAVAELATAVMPQFEARHGGRVPEAAEDALWYATRHIALGDEPRDEFSVAKEISARAHARRLLEGWS
jgi:hypothetical protein